MQRDQTNNVVFVVDDDRAVASYLAEIVRSAGHAVLVFGSAGEALEAIDEGVVPIAVITDLTMPGMDGKGLARAVRFRPNLQRVRIVLISGALDHVSMSDLELFDAAFTKPLVTDHHVAALLTLLRPLQAT